MPCGSRLCLRWYNYTCKTFSALLRAVRRLNLNINKSAMHLQKVLKVIYYGDKRILVS